MPEVRFLGHRLTREHILKAMGKFEVDAADSDPYRTWRDNSAFKFAVDYEGHLYPPKILLSIATGASVHDFNGGEQANGAPSRPWLSDHRQTHALTTDSRVTQDSPHIRITSNGVTHGRRTRKGHQLTSFGDLRSWD